MHRHSWSVNDEETQATCRCGATMVQGRVFPPGGN